MVPMLEPYHVLTILYWLVMFTIAMFVLVRVTGYFAEDTPGTLGKAALTTLLMAGAVYMTYDVSGYVLALIVQEPSAGIRLPPNYTYWDWMREPLALKWYVLGFVPIIRFVPVLLALCMGCVIQVVLWKIPFNLGLVVFLSQVFLDLVAMVVLSFVFSLGIAIYERAVANSAGPQQAVEFIPEQGEPGERPATLYHLKRRMGNLGPEQGPFWRRINAGWESANRSLQPLYNLLQPVTKHLPLPAQDFLNAGGWLVVLPGLAGLALYWPRIHRSRKHQGHPHKKHHQAESPEPRDQLALIGDALTELGARQITVNGLPARLRLVVIAPATRETGAMPRESHAELFDAILPRLREVVAFDFPRVESWTDYHARDRFRTTLEQNVKFPERKEEASHWLLLAGEASLPQGLVHVGLAVYTNEPTTLRVIEVPSGQWATVLGIWDVSAAEEA